MQRSRWHPFVDRNEGNPLPPCSSSGPTSPRCLLTTQSAIFFKTSRRRGAWPAFSSSIEQISQLLSCTCQLPRRMLITTQHFSSACGPWRCTSVLSRLQSPGMTSCGRAGESGNSNVQTLVPGRGPFSPRLLSSRESNTGLLFTLSRALHR